MRSRGTCSARRCSSGCSSVRRAELRGLAPMCAVRMMDFGCPVQRSTCGERRSDNMRRVSSLVVLLALASVAPLAAQAPARARAGAAAQQRPAGPPFTLEPLGWLDGGLLPYKHTQAAYENEYKGGMSPEFT